MAVRIRDMGTNLLFIPLFRLGQNNSELNLALFEEMNSFLTTLGIKSQISPEGRIVVLRIEGKNNIRLFLQLLNQYYPLFLVSTVSHVIDLISLNCRNWLELQLTILRLIYVFPGKKEFTFDY